MEFPRSLLAFRRLFPDEQSCLTYVERTRWPDGFICPKCGDESGDPFRFSRKILVIRCRACLKNTNITAGTAMHRAHSSLRTWFCGAYLMTTRPGLSARHFQHQLKLEHYPTAFYILEKLRSNMALVGADCVGGDGAVVEEAEAIVGAARIPVTGSVEVINGAAVRVWLHVSPDSGEAPVVAVEGAPHAHRMLAELASWLFDTHRTVSRKYIQAYLNEFMFRANMRRPIDAFNALLHLEKMAPMAETCQDETIEAGPGEADEARA